MLWEYSICRSPDTFQLPSLSRFVENVTLALNADCLRGYKIMEHEICLHTVMVLLW